METKTDVLIIGAGPAGLAAAYEIALKGIKVIVIDESNKKGGKLSQQTQFISSLPSHYKNLRGFELAEELVNKLNGLPVRFLLGHRVIGLYKDGSIGITDNKNVFPIKSKKIIVATGASENPVPFPKWTLPGIITIGAAQTLINQDFVIPGGNTVIIGSSDFALETALQLMEVGVKIDGIIEEGSKLLSRDTSLLQRIEKHGINLYFNSFIKEARGSNEVTEIDIQEPNQITTKKVDLVCIDGGRSPILDLFYQLGCSFNYKSELGGWIPQYNKLLQTSLEDVFLAGNAGGISTQGVLLLTGTIAGISVSESLMAVKKEEAELKRSVLWKELERLECALNINVWEGRLEHISKFESPILFDQFLV